MPSKAYMRFQKNSVQVEKFKEAYEEALHKDRRRGKRNLDHFTRAAIMFLCSTFEVYFEEVLKESCSIVTKSLNHPGDLPKQVKKTIAKSIKESKNELECITCEYSCAVTPQVRQTGNRLSGPAGTAYASLLT